MPDKIKVLIADDSPSMCEIISRMLKRNNLFEVIGIVHDGKEAVNSVIKLNPNVVLMDIEMPGMDGLEASRIIMQEYPLPIVIFSSLTSENSEATIKALKYGVVDFLLKPSLADMESTEKILCEKLELASWVKVISRKNTNSDGNSLSRVNALLSRSKQFEKKETGSSRIAVVIGASTGGPTALTSILPSFDFSEESEITYLIVQHMPPVFTKSFAEALDKISNIKVQEAEEGELMANNYCYVAAGGKNIKIGKDGVIHILSPHTTTSSFVPNIDMAMISIADAFHGRVIGVVMTGIGNDGTEGMRYIKSKGGVCLTQDKDTCVVYGMPASCKNEGVTDIEIPLNQIPYVIKEYLKKMK